MLAQVSKCLADLGLPKEALDGWTCHVAQKAGVDVAMVIVRGPEIHFASLTDSPAISRKNVREFMAPVIEEFGYCTTRVPIEITDHKLRRMLGFTQTWADENYTFWYADTLPFNKAPK